MSRDPESQPTTRVSVASPLQGTVVKVEVTPGQEVAAGGTLVIIESMKMEHVVSASRGGTVATVSVGVGDQVADGETLVVIDPGGFEPETQETSEAWDPATIRPDLAETLARQAKTLDPARPEMVERRHREHRRTARENIDDLCDPASFTEYGSLAIAAQRNRRDLEELIARTPADGLVAGIGRVNGDQFGDRAACAALSYDYTVLAGTQGQQNHRKKDRMFDLIERLRLPVVLFAEGGGGRPGDTDYSVITGLDCMAFALFGGLSGLVPLVGIASGRCFAGNAALLGCCDVVIATRESSIGMGGPAMIEGGGLGVVTPDEIGPIDVQTANGVVDLVADDDAHAVRLAKQYLSYFQGSLPEWTCADQRQLRSAIPENRLRVYPVGDIITTLADTGSVLELRSGFGAGMVTALIRVEGRPMGVVANNPVHLGGAIDRDGADKAARFLQLCDGHDLPVLFLCDTPGFMVGPEAEKTGQVRHFSRMFVTGASLTVPFFTVILRKGYGLGAQAMAGGSFRTPLFTVAWPTGELGGMGLEGAVQLGFRRELDAVEDETERAELFDRMVARAYEHGKALNVASAFEIDDVIDPVDTRRRIVETLRAVPPTPPRSGKKRACIDTW
ncbi:MAG TPA: carboxyl transferase domain-containing protein [Acidimicrobiales bacterium]|nr:carboxyl transferase domain-containing protein [Acidimicrobiales bacterium]